MTPKIKIFITGDSCAGKSTTAKALKDRLQIPAFHADEYVFVNLTTKAPYEEVINKVTEILTTNESYVIDAAFDEEPEVFEKVVNDAHIVLNFDVTPQLSIRGFLKRIEECVRNKGKEYTGFSNVDERLGTMDHMKIWLEWYCGHLDRKEKNKHLLDGAAHKTILIRSHADAEKAIEYLTDCVSVDLKNGAALKELAYMNVKV